MKTIDSPDRASNDQPNNVLAGYLSKAELAQQMHKSQRTLDRWETSRAGPPRVVLGKTILYNVESVRSWLQSRERRSRAPKRG
jgi:predicted DNA-binding transcriptional regulator AlpA